MRATSGLDPKPQGQTLREILSHARLMQMTGADAKSIARATERRCKKALS